MSILRTLTSVQWQYAYLKWKEEEQAFHWKPNDERICIHLVSKVRKWVEKLRSSQELHNNLAKQSCTLEMYLRKALSVICTTNAATYLAA